MAEKKRGKPWGLAVFYPDSYLDSTYEIDFDGLYRQGYRGLIFDIDNTLVPHGAPADKRAVELFERLRRIGFRSCFLSNNQIGRVASFNDKIGEQFIEKQEFFRRQGDRVVIPLNSQSVIVQHGFPDRKAVVRGDPCPP